MGIPNQHAQVAKEKPETRGMHGFKWKIVSMEAWTSQSGKFYWNPVSEMVSTTPKSNYRGVMG